MLIKGLNATDRAGGDRDVAALADNSGRLARTSSERAAKRIVRGVQRDQAKILIGLDAYSIDFMARALGSGYQRILSAAMKRRRGLAAQRRSS
ncbi:MAG: hypothetical protein ACRDQ7_23420 [Haloechinothrix sp.]